MKKAELVYSSLDYAHLPKTVLSSSDESKCYFSGEEETLDDIIIKKYISLMFKQKQKLNDISFFLYGKKSEVPENQTRNAFLKIIDIEKRLGKTFKSAIAELKSAINKNTYFFHKQNPIAISNILNAHKAFLNNASQKDVWYQLLN